MSRKIATLGFGTLLAFLSLSRSRSIWAHPYYRFSFSIFFNSLSISLVNDQLCFYQPPMEIQTRLCVCLTPNSDVVWLFPCAYYKVEHVYMPVWQTPLLLFIQCETLSQVILLERGFLVMLTSNQHQTAAKSSVSFPR